MKKIIYALISISVIFSSCEEQISEALSLPSSCGTVNVTFDGVSQNYNPLLATCATLNEVSATEIQLFLYSSCPSGIIPLPDYEIVIKLTDTSSSQINVNQTYTISASPLDPYLVCNLITFDCSNQLAEPTSYTNNDINGSLFNGEVTFTNIDNTNQTIDGEFSFTAYQIGDTSNTKTVSCTFSDVPF